MATAAPTNAPHPRAVAKERLLLLRRIDHAFEKPMIVLGILWLGLLVLQLVEGSKRWIDDLTFAVWIVFVVDFLLRFTIAPHKRTFLKRHWLVALSLALPALSVLRLTRVLALVPSWQVLIFRLITGLNRSISVVGSTMRRRGMAYVLAVSVIVTFAGAAGIYALEPHTANGIPNFGYALWWTGMIMTTMGSSYYPQTAGGQILCFLLAVFAFSIFGYITAAIASYFVHRDASDGASRDSTQPSLADVMNELQSLRAELTELRRQR
ncbi:MAG TPA: ion channel [Candidatus Aquilonibacter sp.]|nr:ion channel [Candidatus Aquilonibacter sp.]